VLALEPLTYMNLSGQSVGEAMRFLKLQPSDVVVFHDDLDLAPGKLKVKKGGGHGGHNGLRSLDQHIGQDYWRVRIGIGHPGRKEMVEGYVLHAFAKTDQTWIEPLVDAIADALPTLLAGDAARFLNDVALKTGPVG
jgi:PTH1 family peptidyl-tRNA hydrolase